MSCCVRWQINTELSGAGSSLCAGCFPCQSEKISLYSLVSFGIRFCKQRGWKSFSLGLVRDAFVHVPVEMSCQVMKPHPSALCLSCSGLGSEGPVSLGMLW